MRLAFVVVALGVAACGPPELPGPEDTAAYLNLAVGETFRFQVGENVSETHELAQSTILSNDGLVFEHIAKQNGFLVQERTFSLEVDVDSAQIVRLGDCIVECGELSGPIELFGVPLKAGQQRVTTVEVVRSQNGQVQETVSETHTVVVGDKRSVSVPAGTFEGFDVSWRRVRGEGDAEIALLVVVPETGFVSWDGFDGSQLRRQ